MITLLNPQLDSSYMDVWGEFLPFALQSWIPIMESRCFAPRWFQLPINSLETMAIGGYNSWSLQLPPGSFILEIMHHPTESEGEVNSGNFSVQITDTNIDHRWFSQPLPDILFYKQQETGRNGHVLPKPYPVIGAGNFQFERYCTVAGKCELVMAVAVPEKSA